MTERYRRLFAVLAVLCILPLASIIAQATSTYPTSGRTTINMTPREHASSSNLADSGPSLVEAAKQAVAKHPQGAMEISLAFAQQLDAKDWLATHMDRHVKFGRRLRSLVEMYGTQDTEVLSKSLQNLWRECQLLVDGSIKVPHRRFGKTGLSISMVTLGCMRFQQEWGPRITQMDQVGADCQENLVEILKTAILQYGINHIETARGYGCSELQLGVALQQLMAVHDVRREDLIIQTKVAPADDPQDFRDNLEKSFRNLQVDYLDLFAFHGLNLPRQMDWIFRENGCMAVVDEYRRAGKIKHVGFSTHGPTDLIGEAIKTDAFDYVNLHNHYFGSYTGTGGGSDGQGNRENMMLLKERDMGVFIISPYDKGGRVYAPSNKLLQSTLPEMEPMEFGTQYLYLQHLLDPTNHAEIHTFTVGAGRPSDLDQPALFAHLTELEPEETLANVRTVTERMDKIQEEALGKDWSQNWWKGLPKSAESKYAIEHNQIVWLYNLIHSFGMYNFAKNRYSSFEGNNKKWDDSKSREENIQAVGLGGWGFVPGISLKPGFDYTEDFANVPVENLARVKEAEGFVLKWCASPEAKKDEEGEAQDEVPDDWKDAYDMRPWQDFPDQARRPE